MELEELVTEKFNMSKKIINDELCAQVKQLHSEKILSSKICEKLNISRFIVRKIYKKLNLLDRIKDPLNISSYDPKLLEKVKELFNKEMGTRGIAKELNLSRKTIKNIFMILNLKNKPGPPIIIKSKRTEYTCLGCKQTLPIDNFINWINENGRFRNESRCHPCLKEFYKVRRKEKRIEKKLDPQWGIRHSISNSILKVLKTNNSTKNNRSCLEKLEFTMEQLKQHLELRFDSWMNWNNWGKYNAESWNDNDPSTWTWQLDHIIPHSTFNYTSMDDDSFKECWSLNNLRPYSAKQNVLDGVRRTRHKNISPTK